jgi:hypothetical protein
MTPVPVKESQVSPPCAPGPGSFPSAPRAAIRVPVSVICERARRKPSIYEVLLQRPDNSVGSPAGREQASRMKPSILTILLLVSTLAFGQKFQDVSQKGSPLSLKIDKIDSTDPDSYVIAHNNSGKGVLAIVAFMNFKDATGQGFPLTTRQDYAFKVGVLKSHEERGIAPVNIDSGIKITEGVGTVLFVPYEDGTTWGDAGAGKQLLDSRPKRLAFLKRLVELYYESGQDAFDAALNEHTLDRSELSVAGCLKSDAEYEKMATIDLAKKRLADAQEWRALGIF